LRVAGVAARVVLLTYPDATPAKAAETTAYTPRTLVGGVK
jgi:hypothetical protein